MKHKYIDFLKEVYAKFGKTEFKYRDIDPEIIKKQDITNICTKVLLDAKLIDRVSHVKIRRQNVNIYRINSRGEMLATGVIKRVI